MAVVRTRKHVHQPRDHALFALLANTGMRPAEALALTRADLHLEARPPWVRLRRIKRPHAAEPINRLIIHKAVASVVRRYANGLEPGARLFPFTKRQMQRLFNYYAARGGVEKHRVYSMRHAVGMRLWRHTQDLRIIHGIMGHVRLKASAIYVHVTPEQIREAFRAIGTVC